MREYTRAIEITITMALIVTLGVKCVTKNAGSAAIELPAGCRSVHSTPHTAAPAPPQTLQTV